MKFHADSSSVKIRHVNSGILPCVITASLKNDVQVAINAISDMLRQKESPPTSRRRVVLKDKLRYCRESIQLGCV